jgi:type II secretory pathway pseudopilin PulG
MSKTQRSRFLDIRGPGGEAGVTLIEVLIAAGILALVVSSLLVIRSHMTRQTMNAKEVSYATQRVMSMMEELRYLVSGQEAVGVLVLDNYDQPDVNDASAPATEIYSKLLTTDTAVTDPGNPISGNVRYGQGWKYLRNIQVEAVEGDDLSSVRRVTIRIYKTGVHGPDVPADADHPIIEVASVLQTLPTVYWPSQEYDVYVLAIENVTGWWTAINQMRYTMDDVITGMERRNPGLKFRVHWITRNAYGRDLEYVPFLNETVSANAQNIPGVYFYPGHVRDATGAKYNIFDQLFMQGRVNVDGSDRGISDFPYLNYPLADQFNHAVRYPDEVRLYDEAVSIARALKASNPDVALPEPSLRMVLEEMNDPVASRKYRNALFINLHGEVLPLPPMRNYSDAAKDPISFPERRVVTHPENLRYNTGDDVVLRVYPYLIHPDSYATTLKLPEITLWMPGLSLADPLNVEVRAIKGDNTVDYSYASAVTAVDYTMAVTSLGGVNGVLLNLFNTPLRHPERVVGTSNTGGLPVTCRLYGLEYIPCLPGSATADFHSYDLTAAGRQAKNTARWEITLKPGVFPANGMYSFETRIGADLSTGTHANKPADVSRTYVWRGVDPPSTERYQFLGDPRWCPYADVKAAHGYNWYFRTVNLASQYIGFDRCANGWGDGVQEFDVPRFYQAYRNALLGCQAIWSTLNGMSYYYACLGGEFGGDVAPLNNGVWVNSNPYIRTGTPGSVRVDEIYDWLGASFSHAQVVSKADPATTNPDWAALPWIGELYPDSAYASQWVSIGNLTAGPGNFYRKGMDSTWYRQVSGGVTTNVSLGRKPNKRIYTHGATTFMNQVQPVSGSAYLRHASGTYTGNLLAIGTEAMKAFNFPLLTNISATRPFYNSSDAADRPTHFTQAEYSGTRVNLSMPTTETFYDSSRSSTSKSSAIVTLQDPGTTPRRTTYINLSGLDTQGNFGRTQMAQFTLMGMMMAYLNAGLKSSEYHITQLPKVDIRYPRVNEMIKSDSVTLAWTTTWERWGDKSAKYTDAYPSPYTADSGVTLIHVPLFRQGRSGPWYYLKDPALEAEVGVLPSAASGVRLNAGEIAFDAGTGLSSYVWSITTLPQETFMMRLETYRQDYALHYSFDQTIFMRK